MKSSPNISTSMAESNIFFLKVKWGNHFISWISILCWSIKKMKCSVLCVLYKYAVCVYLSGLADYCLFGSFFRPGPGGAVIVVAAFYSSELRGELFDVFINLRPACLEAAGWHLDLGAPCFLHLTCTQESSITCPAWGLRWLEGDTKAVEKIKLYFPAQYVPMERFSLELTLLALMNKSGRVWQWKVRRFLCHHKPHRRNSELSSLTAFVISFVGISAFCNSQM